MRYISTRGSAPSQDFRGALLAGLASDGGLYVPETVPQFSPRDLAAMAEMDYETLAFTIIRPFVGETFNDKQLHRMLATAYGRFSHPAIAPLTQLGQGHFLLELFHGPTLSFKDFALQLLGQMMGTLLAGTGQKSIVLGATSGDTGSAAIAGCLKQKDLSIVILYPEGRVSDVQRRQMTTTGEGNVHALAVKGTFDDCQKLVKAAFADQALRQKINLLAVNSINWARVMAQTVYYFYAALSLGAPATKVNFCVPTGNFGDIFAGYMAKKMGLPIGRLIIATNENDILARCVDSGEYKTNGVKATLSPAMDIEVSSNFERLLFDLYGRDGKKLAQAMASFSDTGALSLPAEVRQSLIAEFSAQRVDDKATLATIAETYQTSGLLLDPHSAVGVHAAQHFLGEIDGPIVTLATASPAKFPEAVKQATGINPPLPPHMADLYARQETTRPMAADRNSLNAFLAQL